MTSPLYGGICCACGSPLMTNAGDRSRAHLQRVTNGSSTAGFRSGCRRRIEDPAPAIPTACRTIAFSRRAPARSFDAQLCFVHDLRPALHVLAYEANELAPR